MSEKKEVLEDLGPEAEPAEKNQEPELLEDELPVFDTPVEELEIAPPADKLKAVVFLDRLVYQARSKNSMSVRVLQALLETQGYPVGSDRRGWLSDGTRDALLAYQTDIGLPATGLADEDTVEALFATSTRYVWDR